MSIRALPTISLVMASFPLWAQSDLPPWAKERIKAIQTEYAISKYIQPYFLEADLSGDKRTDIAVLVQRKADKKKGIAIVFADKGRSFILGAGKQFGNAGDDFTWANKWEIFSQKTTYETTFKEDGDVEGGREVKLDNPAIEIREDEGSGGLIYFDGKKFRWIHQGD